MVKAYYKKNIHSINYLFYLSFLFFSSLSFLYGKQGKKTLAQLMKEKSNPSKGKLVSGKDEQGYNVSYIKGSRRDKIEQKK
jgi:hypothetical protein